MNACNYLTIIIRDNCPDEPRVFPAMTEDTLKRELREYAECGTTRFLVATLTPAQWREFWVRPSEVEEVPGIG